MKSKILPILAFLAATCATSVKETGEGAILYKNIEKHIATLSSDRFEGRMPTTRSEKITIDYIASQMKEIGLEPATNGSFFQEIPLLSVHSTISNTLDFETPKGALNLQKMVDYVSFSRREEAELSLDHSQ